MAYLHYSIILVCVISIECKTWFLATDIKKVDEVFYASRVPTQGPKEPQLTSQLESLNFTKTFKINTSTDLNNIQNLNPMSQPKRKIVRRRCTETKQNHSKSHNALRSRFLEVFEVVQFEHVMCFSSTGLEGTCLHDYDCQKINGTSMGTCADGYGICCIILLKCDTHSSAPSGWLTNPNYPGPSTDRLSCTLTLDKTTTEIKQLRLDFMNFEILPPTSGTCEQDQFVVTGQNINNVIPVLCGINSGQHLYIEVSKSVKPITFSFQTISSENRLFAIKITQLSLSDTLSAPTGCLQYYKEDQGHIESFNYRDTTEIGITRAPSYLNNMNYAMCIYRKADSCSVTYTNAGDMQLVNYDTGTYSWVRSQVNIVNRIVKFSYGKLNAGVRLPHSAANERAKIGEAGIFKIEEGLPVLPPRQAGVEIIDCPSDWLLISAIRLCGERLNDGSVLQDFSLDAPITDDAAGPIIIWFRSDGIYTGRGYRLHYQQNMCMENIS